MKFTFAAFCFLLVLVLGPAIMSPAKAQATADEMAGFEARQQLLIDLAGTLGALHELRKLCYYYDRPNLFRDRMKELIALEEPAPATQDKMINAFNSERRKIENRFDFCDAEAEFELQRLAKAGQEQVAALSKPFTPLEDYDYYPGVETVDGVTVYRPRPRDND